MLPGMRNGRLTALLHALQYDNSLLAEGGTIASRFVRPWSTHPIAALFDWSPGSAMLNGPSREVVIAKNRQLFDII
jgi:hypothetical protein